MKPPTATSGDDACASFLEVWLVLCDFYFSVWSLISMQALLLMPLETLSLHAFVEALFYVCVHNRTLWVCVSTLGGGM
jgi:hypothetical protein